MLIWNFIKRLFFFKAHNAKYGRFEYETPERREFRELIRLGQNLITMRLGK